MEPGENSGMCILSGSSCLTQHQILLDCGDSKRLNQTELLQEGFREGGLEQLFLSNMPRGRQKLVEKGRKTSSQIPRPASSQVHTSLWRRSIPQTLQPPFLELYLELMQLPHELYSNTEDLTAPKPQCPSDEKPSSNYHPKHTKIIPLLSFTLPFKSHGFSSCYYFLYYFCKGFRKQYYLTAERWDRPLRRDAAPSRTPSPPEAPRRCGSRCPRGRVGAAAGLRERQILPLCPPVPPEEGGRVPGGVTQPGGLGEMAGTASAPLPRNGPAAPLGTDQRVHPIDRPTLPRPRPKHLPERHGRKHGAAGGGALPAVGAALPAGRGALPVFRRHVVTTTCDDNVQQSRDRDLARPGFGIRNLAKVGCRTACSGDGAR
ncbi:uncharacterized protein LOC141922946 [Strix aluco]|uniref:uncharacterized protein LOC141922946 n=1 Tax=Strix aluco TaxID=111821 RepID=UPI003DA6C1CF